MEMLILEGFAPLTAMYQLIKKCKDYDDNKNDEMLLEQIHD